MRMSRTSWPHRVDELIMHVLLRVIDDPLNVLRNVIAKLPKPDGIVHSEVVVARPGGGVEIVNKSPNNVPLVSISDRHS